MSRFRKLAYSIWYCQYHLLWAPKYRYRVLTESDGQWAKRFAAMLVVK